MIKSHSTASNDDCHSDTLPNVDEATRRSIHGIIGIINLISGPYLIVITSKIRIGDIKGQTIYKVAATEMIAYARNMSHLNEYQVNCFQAIDQIANIDFLAQVQYQISIHD